MTEAWWTLDSNEIRLVQSLASRLVLMLTTEVQSHTDSQEASESPVLTDLPGKIDRTRPVLRDPAPPPRPTNVSPHRDSVSILPPNPPVLHHSASPI